MNLRIHEHVFLSGFGGFRLLVTLTIFAPTNWCAPSCNESFMRIKGSLINDLLPTSAQTKDKHNIEPKRINRTKNC